MILEYGGRQWQFDKNAITIDEWRELKRKYKMTPAQFQTAIGEADPDASTFMYWVMLRQNGDQRLLLGDHLKPDIVALNEALSKAEPDEEDAGEAEADPTTSSPPPPSPAPSVSPPAPPSQEHSGGYEGVSVHPTGS